jgi:hypothetical protein
VNPFLIFLFCYPARHRAGDAGDGDFTIGRISHVMSGYKAGELRILTVAGDKRLLKQLGENANSMAGADYEKVRMQQTEAYEGLVKNLTGR